MSAAVMASAPRREARTTTTSFYKLSFCALIAAMVGPIIAVDHHIPIDSASVPVLGTFILTGIASMTGLYYAAAKRPFTLNTAHWVFIIFFLFYAPFLQFYTHMAPDQTEIGAFDRYAVQANGLILAWCIVYAVFYDYGFRKRWSSPVRKPIPLRRVANYLLLALATIAAAALAVKVLSLGGLLSRGANFEEGYGHHGQLASAGGVSKPVALITNIFIRALPMVVLALVLTRGKRNNAFYLAIVPISLAALLTNFPLGVARFWAGVTILGITCSVIRNKKYTGLWLPLILFFSFIVVMPFLNLFRYVKLSHADVSSYKQDDLQTIMSKGDFDAYSMVTDTIAFCARPNTTYPGQQLLGNLAFFVPRSLWQEKPDGSGVLIGTTYALTNINLDEPLMAEGYINFGVVGVFIYAIVFSIILGTLDATYWRASDRGGDMNPLLHLMYPFLVGFTVYIMRGDFLSSFAYTCGFSASGWIALKISGFGISRRVATMT